MQYKVACERWMQSKSFLEDQFILEKAVLEKINGRCLQLQHPMEFKRCTTVFKDYRKSYRKVLQSLLERREEELKAQLQSKCLASPDMQSLKSCLDEQTGAWMNNHFRRDTKFLSELRSLTIERLIAQD